MANWFLVTKHSVRNLLEQSDRTVLRVHIITGAQSQLVTKEHNASLSNAQPVNLTATRRPAAWNQNIVIHIGFHIEHTFYWFDYQCKHRMLGEQKFEKDVWFFTSQRWMIYKLSSCSSKHPVCSLLPNELIAELLIKQTGG